MTGKWHLTQTCDRLRRAVTPSHRHRFIQFLAVTTRGFEHFFGFLNGLEHPQTTHILYEDNKHIFVDRYPENYWTQRAIALLKQAKTKSTDKLF